MELLHALFFCSPNIFIMNTVRYKMSHSNNMLFVSKSQDEDSQMMTEVDLFISTKAVKVLNADTQVSNSQVFVSWFSSLLWIYFQTWLVIIIFVFTPCRRQWWTVPCVPSPTSPTLAALWFWWRVDACRQPHQRISQNLLTLPAKGRVSTGWSAMFLSQRM